MPRIVCYNLFDKGAYIMDTNANIKDLKKVVKTLRIVWCFTLVFAVVFLALGINSLVTMARSEKTKPPLFSRSARQ